jgi:hypothetical protein
VTYARDPSQAEKRRGAGNRDCDVTQQRDTFSLSDRPTNTFLTERFLGASPVAVFMKHLTHTQSHTLSALGGASERASERRTMTALLREK